MSAEPGDLIGESPPVGKPGPPSTGRGCRRGCLPWCVVGFLLFLVGVCGLGLPTTYWHALGYAQVFEGPDRVVLFVEVQQAMEWPGFLMTPGYYNAVAFFRIDVFPDGRVERTALQCDLEGEITLNTNLYAGPIVRPGHARRGRIRRPARRG